MQYGMNGLLKMESIPLMEYKFQYTTENMAGKRNWIEINDFNKIINEKLNVG